MSKKILIVDDDPDILFILNSFLTHAGYKVVLADGGKDALAKAESEKPDMVILDILMPDMDGWEVCTKIREVFPVIPISMCSILTKPHQIEKSFKAGANEHIMKPLKKEKLLSTVKNCLDHPHKRRHGLFADYNVAKEVI